MTKPPNEPEYGPNAPYAGRMRLVRWIIARDNQKKAAEILGIGAVDLNQYEYGKRFPSKRALSNMEDLCGITQNFLKKGDVSKLTGHFGRAIAFHKGPYPAPLRPRDCQDFPEHPSTDRSVRKSRGKGTTEHE